MKLKNIILATGLTAGSVLVSCSKKDQQIHLSISAISPVAGPSSTLDTITGTGFSAEKTSNGVSFNGKNATVISATSTQLIVKVPFGGTTGKVSVQVKGNQVEGPVFTYTGDSIYMVSTLLDGGPTSGDTKINNLISLVVDKTGNLYALDSWYEGILLINPSGFVAPFAGDVNSGSNDGVGLGARFNGPAGITMDANGNMYVADAVNNSIRKVTPDRVVTTLAGSVNPGYADGTGRAARFWQPRAITVDGNGNLYVYDFLNYRIRKVTASGTVTTVAGSGIMGTADGVGAAAGFGIIKGMCTDPNNNVYAADIYNFDVRKITPSAVVTTFAGSPSHPSFANGIGENAYFSGLSGLASDKYGNIYVADADNQVIRKITPGAVVTTLAGTPSKIGSTDGLSNVALFDEPAALAVDQNGVIYVAESGKRIRVLTPQ